MRITKDYTKGGDQGETSLVGGERVSKASARVDAYGEVDELNSVIGMARAALQGKEQGQEIDQVLAVVQNDLFTVGGDLASPSGVAVPRVEESLVKKLEETSDRFLADLKPLKEFILPGGSQAGASLHLARAVARRAERRAVSLQQSEEINTEVVVYLNRLSDLLFILARAVNHRAAMGETMTDFSKKSR